jgi:hypothetical protein
MVRTVVGLAVILAATSVVHAQDGPSMEDVVAAPADYGGKTLTFRGVALSGNVTKYDVGNIRKYYLQVASKSRTFEAGFFLAPPAVADRLIEKMDAKKNYGVNLVCKIEQITINGVPQWHGIVGKVEFVDADGKVTDTVELPKK